MACRFCREGEVQRTFLLSGPRSMEKRSFHLPCPICRTEDHGRALERLSASLDQWSLTIRQEEQNPRSGKSTEDLGVPTVSIGFSDEDPHSSTFRI